LGCFFDSQPLISTNKADNTTANRLFGRNACRIRKKPWFHRTLGSVSCHHGASFDAQVKFFCVKSFVTYKDVPVHIVENSDTDLNSFQTFFYARRAEVGQSTSPKIVRTHDSITHSHDGPAATTVRLDGFVNVELFRSGIDFLTGGTSKIQIGQTRYENSYLESLSLNASPQSPPTCSMTFRCTNAVYFPSGYVGVSGLGSTVPVDGYSTGIVPDVSVGWQLKADDARMDTITGATQVTTNITIDRSYHYNVGKGQYSETSFIDRLEKQIIIDFTGVDANQSEMIDFSGYQPPAADQWHVEYISNVGRVFQVDMRIGGDTKMTQETWSMDAGGTRSIRNTYIQPVL
jgi:hypothetical protein